MSLGQREMEAWAESLLRSSMMTTQWLCPPIRVREFLLRKHHVASVLWQGRVSQAEGRQKLWHSEPGVWATVRATACCSRPVCPLSVVSAHPSLSLCARLCLTSSHLSTLSSFSPLFLLFLLFLQPFTLSSASRPLSPRPFLDCSFQEHRRNCWTTFRY